MKRAVVLAALGALALSGSARAQPIEPRESRWFPLVELAYVRDAAHPGFTSERAIQAGVLVPFRLTGHRDSRARLTPVVGGLFDWGSRDHRGVFAQLGGAARFGGPLFAFVMTAAWTPGASIVNNEVLWVGDPTPPISWARSLAAFRFTLGPAIDRFRAAFVVHFNRPHVHERPRRRLWLGVQLGTTF